jgi:glutathione S-transferase
LTLRKCHSSQILIFSLNPPKNVIALYQLFPAFGLPDASPFCVKVETFLRMVDHPYRNVYLGYPKNAPKGKLPYIDDGRKRIADSGFIVRYLIGRYGYGIDAHLTKSQHGIGLAMTRLLEDHLYWVIVHTRWLDDAHWPEVRRLFFGNLPAGIRQFVSAWARGHMRRESVGHGIGRHAFNDIIEMGADDIEAVSDILADNPFILGDRISSYDATVYAFIASVLLASLETPLKQAVMRFPNLHQYCLKIQSLYFGE